MSDGVDVGRHGGCGRTGVAGEGGEERKSRSTGHHCEGRNLYTYNKLFTTVGGRALAKTNFGIVRDMTDGLARSYV